MPVADRLLPRGGLVDGVEREGYFDELLAVRGTHAASSMVPGRGGALLVRVQCLSAPFRPLTGTIRHQSSLIRHHTAPSAPHTPPSHALPAGCGGRSGWTSGAGARRRPRRDAGCEP